jgi:3-methyladenine DNA glycosylase Tag
MIIWKWSLFQTILDAFTFKKKIISYDETHVPTIDNEEKLVLRRNKILSIKKSKKDVSQNVQFQG